MLICTNTRDAKDVVPQIPPQTSQSMSVLKITRHVLEITSEGPCPHRASYTAPWQPVLNGQCKLPQEWLVASVSVVCSSSSFPPPCILPIPLAGV